MKMSENFAEAYKRPGDPDWYWKVYHYDATGDREIITHRAKEGYATPQGAEDAVAEFLETNNIEADLIFR
jgi:hypothetical protein